MLFCTSESLFVMVQGGSVQQEKPTAPKTNQKGGF